MLFIYACISVPLFNFCFEDISSSFPLLASSVWLCSTMIASSCYPASICYHILFCSAIEMDLTKTFGKDYQASVRDMFTSRF
jgi:hypothetical protein